MKPHRATLVLVFGILGFVACPFLGIAAWVMGNRDLEEMDHGLMDPSGREMTNAGRICGMVSTGLLILQTILFVIVLFTMVVARA
jgi:hypothetical protein